jgi:methyl coenzyme M reductase subunit C-like uncharacterized protein (methanogenesis marker protein 7)
MLRLAEGLEAQANTIEPPAEPMRNLEGAIVAATLARRHATAELLADRLRERLARDRTNVVSLDHGSGETVG